MNITSILVGMMGGIVIGVLAGPLVTERGTQAGKMTAENMDMEVDAVEADMDMEMDTMTMDPDSVEVATDSPIPQVRIVEAFQDEMGAYSVRIETENFSFTPQNVDNEPVANEGHAHVYVNNVKVGREYAEWIYVPASFFSSSEPNRITVTLNANTHGEWTYLDSPIQDTLMVN